MFELSKKDKRLCREYIHKGLEQECEEFVKGLHEVAGKAIPLAELNAPYQEENGRSVEGPWHKRYIQLFKLMDSFDTHVAYRYNHATGGHYFDVVSELYVDGWLTDEDIEQFDEEIAKELKDIKRMNG